MSSRLALKKTPAKKMTAAASKNVVQESEDHMDVTPSPSVTETPPVEEEQEEQGEEGEEEEEEEEAVEEKEEEEIPSVAPAVAPAAPRKHAGKTIVKPFERLKKKHGSSTISKKSSAPKPKGFSMKDFKRLKTPKFDKRYSSDYKYAKAVMKLAKAPGNEYAWAKKAFISVVREVAADFQSDLRFTDGALCVLNEAAHDVIGTLFSRSVVFACDSKRVTIMTRDLQRAAFTMPDTSLRNYGDFCFTPGSKRFIDKKKKKSKSKSAEEPDEKESQEKKEKRIKPSSPPSSSAKKSVAKRTAESKNTGKVAAGISRS